MSITQNVTLKATRQMTKIVGESDERCDFLVLSTKNTSGGKKTSLDLGTSNVFILLERLILMQRDQSELICLVSQRTHLFVQKKCSDE